MNIFIYAIVAILCSIIPTLITLWLNEKVKGSVKNSFDKILEEVKKEHSKEISQFQTELNYLKSKESFKFTKLHEKRFEVLQKTYKYLNQTLKQLGIYVSPVKITPTGKTHEEHKDMLKKNFISVHNEFLEYYNYNNIFFDKDIEKLLDKYFISTTDVFFDFNTNDFLSEKDKTYDDELSRISAYAYKKIPVIIEPIKKEIEFKFKELLGN